LVGSVVMRGLADFASGFAGRQNVVAGEALA
jgi:hypothetical protein